MPTTLAIMTSVPNLLRCQVEQVRARLPSPSQVPRAVGLGYFESGEILLRKKPGDVGTTDLSELVRDVSSEVLFFWADKPGGDRAFSNEDVMPLRHRRWLFMHRGLLASPVATRAALLRQMPDFLARQAKGSTESELCLLTFVDLMRDGGLSEEEEPPPGLVGARLAQAARRVERAERESGKVGSLGFYVTDGRVLAATRLFSGPLHYALLEGIARCPRCNLTEHTPDSDPLVRAHRRLRGVVVASDLADPQGFIEVGEQSLLTVGPDLQVRVAPLARS